MFIKTLQTTCVYTYMHTLQSTCVWAWQFLIILQDLYKYGGWLFLLFSGSKYQKGVPQICISQAQNIRLKTGCVVTSQSSMWLTILKDCNY